MQFEHNQLTLQTLSFISVIPGLSILNQGGTSPTATFQNFTLSAETSWAKKVVKSILETWNVNDVIVYVWFIYFQVKNIKNMQCKKEQF